MDDTVTTRYMVRLLLDDLGRFEVVGEAADGATAVEVAGATRPGAILLDLEMPGVTGWDALPRLREAAPEAVIVTASFLPEGVARPSDTLAPDGGHDTTVEADASVYKVSDDWVEQAAARMLELASARGPGRWPSWERRRGEQAPAAGSERRRGTAFPG
ncbi:MAG TPA: response regulator transcription factor [Acidimicrobiales bacterium]|nr:response regulator transcription factor [Acidimicrobiales bacterium]